MSNKRIYEVTTGFTLSNHTPEEVESFIETFASFLKVNNSTITIFKLNSSYRADITQHIIEEDLINAKKKDIEKQTVLAVNLDILKEEKKRKTPSIFLMFENFVDSDLDSWLKVLEDIVSIKKISQEDWTAHKYQFLEKSLNWKEKKDRLVFDNGESKSITKIHFKRNLPNLWLRNLFFNEDVEYSIRIEKPTIKQLEKIRKSIKHWSDAIPDDELKNSLQAEASFSSKESKRDFLMEAMMGENNIINVKGYVALKLKKEIRRTAKQQVNDLSLKLESDINGSNFKIQLQEYEQTIALKRFFGLEEDHKYTPANINSAASIFPFENTTVMEENGLYLGKVDSWFGMYMDPRNKKTKTALHTGVLGQTGSGKSVLLKLMAINEITKYDPQYIILDPHNEYGPLQESFGGKVTDISDIKLNPIKIFNYKSLANDKNNKLINNLALSFKSFLATSLSEEIKSNGSLIEKIRNISDDLKNFLISKKNYLAKGKEYTIQDFYNSFNVTQKKEYNSILKTFIDGTLSMFNVVEEFDLNNKLNIIQLRSLQDSQEQSYKQSVFKLLFMRMVQVIYSNEGNQKELTLLIDEAADFFRDEYLLSLISPIFKDARKFNTKLIWGTQNLTDLVGGSGKEINPLLVNIWSNTVDKYIGTLDGVQIQVLDSLLKEDSRILNSSERSHITANASGKSNAGNFLFTSGRKRHSLEVAFNEVPGIIELMLTKKQREGGI